MPKTIEKPDVALQSMDIEKASLTDATVMLKLEVRNPNDFTIPVESMKYGLNINGKPFASGQMAEGAKLKAKGDSEITVPIRMKYWDLFSQFKDLMKNKPNSYQIIGTINAGGREIPFENKGEVTLPTG